MKKITALILVLCMLLSAFVFAACGNQSSDDKGNSTNGGNNSSDNTGDNNSSDKKEESIYETVAAAIEKTLKAKSYDANIDMQNKTNLMGNLSEDSLDVSIKATALDTDKPKVNVDGKQTMMGYTYDQKLYYDGQWKYFDMHEDGGYKSQCTFEEFAKEAGAPQNIVVALPEALFKDAQSKKNDDGSVTVTLTVDEATMETIYKDAITKIVYDVVGNDLNQAVTKDASITVTVADGYVRNYAVSFVCEITAGSDKVTYDITNTVEFVSCDQDVTVTPPANLDKFYEMDWG